MISMTSAASATAVFISAMTDPRSRGSSCEGFVWTQSHPVLGGRDRVGSGHVGLNGGGDLFQNAEPPRQGRERKLLGIGPNLAPQILVREGGAIAHDLPPHRVAVVVERERYRGEESPTVALDPGAPERAQYGGRLGMHEKLERGGTQARELRFARRLLPRGVDRRLEERERPPQAPLRRRGQEPGRGLGDPARFDERRGDEIGRQRAEPHVEAAGGDRREERPDPPRAKDQYPA